jgi:Ti-type conjugative transfer relaxase TraA
MIPRCVVGRGVTGAVRYILGEGRDPETGELAVLPEGQPTRVAWIGGTGFGFEIESREDAELARKMMEFDAVNQTSRTKRCEKDCVHLALGWHPGENPSREEMERAAHDALKSLGMENARAIFAAHTDENYSHIHIVASKINPETGKAYDLRGNYLTLSRWAEQHELEHGGVVCLRRQDANRLRDAVAARDPEAVLEAMTQQRATFTARDLDGILRKQIKATAARNEFFEQVMTHPNVVQLADRPGGPAVKNTTKAVLETEFQVIRAAEALSRARGFEVNASVHTAVLGSRAFGTMLPDQAAAYRHATGPEGLTLIDGQAGAGKSYTMAAIREAYERSGWRVIGLAPTHKVVAAMQGDGFTHAATVHSELFALNNGRARWDAKTVVMLDEAAMIDTKIMAGLTQHARAAGSKLILTGDDRQLSSIDRGGMFGVLKERYGAAMLTEVIRQRKDDDRRASSMMAEGNFHDALTMYEAKHAIVWTRTQNEARTLLVKRWAADTAAAPDKTRFVFAYTNADVAQLNADLRAVRVARGELGPDHSLPTVDGRQNFARGDRIQIIGTDKGVGLRNGMAGTIQEIDGTRVTVKLDGRREGVRSFDAKDFSRFRHGYAGTIYRGQGDTLDQSYLYHSEHWRSTASYVGLTRHRDSALLFVARNTARDLRQLAKQMARVDDRRAASHFYRVGEDGDSRHRTLADVAAEQARTDDEDRSKPRLDIGLDWTSRGGMVAQQRSAMDWAKEAHKDKSARAEQTDRKRETTDADRARTQMREALLREFGREVEHDLGDEHHPGRERSR